MAYQTIVGIPFQEETEQKKYRQALDNIGSLAWASLKD